MVRQDKIAYIITFFQTYGIEIPSGEAFRPWLDNYIHLQFPQIDNFESGNGGLLIENNDISTKFIESIIEMNDRVNVFPANIVNNRIFVRLGIISTSNISETKILMSEYIPYNKHALLFYNVEKIGNIICTPFNPDCNNCGLSEVCDYFNNKNDWRLYN